MDHPDLAAHFALNAPEPWLDLMGELDEYYEILAYYDPGNPPTRKYFSSKQDRALLDRFVEYWTALPKNLYPTALGGFLHSYDWYCVETEMAA